MPGSTASGKKGSWVRNGLSPGRSRLSLSARNGGGCRNREIWGASARRVLPPVQLAQGFVQDDAHGSGQVQAADLSRGHGNAKGLPGIALQKDFGQAMGLASKQQTITRLVDRL